MKELGAFLLFAALVLLIVSAAKAVAGAVGPETLGVFYPILSGGNGPERPAVSTN